MGIWKPEKECFRELFAEDLRHEMGQKGRVERTPVFIVDDHSPRLLPIPVLCKAQVIRGELERDVEIAGEKDRKRQLLSKLADGRCCFYSTLNGLAFCVWAGENEDSMEGDGSKLLW